jgi:flagellar motility protein MotE (MotC chaperone)
MIRKPSLLMLTAVAAAVSTVAHAVSAVAPPPEAPATRLGTEINQDMATLEEASRRRGRAIEMREQAAKATEARLKAELRARQQAAGDPAGPGGAAAAKEVQYDNLARIYQSMKPAKAALVFEQLDMDVQLKVAQRMRDRSTAMILAAMTPKGAADLSMSLARKEALKPKPVPVAAPAPVRRAAL